MRRRTRALLPLLAALALVVASCAGGDTGPGTTGAADGPVSTPVTAAPTTSTPAGSGTAATTVPGPATTADSVDDGRPVAPDFTLDLGDGGTFVLSEETRPVFLVFWAEW